MTGWIQEIDLAILLFLQEHVRMAWMDGFWRFITSLGNAGWFWIMTAAFLLLFPKTRRIGGAAALSMFFGFLLTNVLLKNLVARTRPYDLYEALIPLIEKPHDFSFPSGHTCVSFAAALVYMRMAPGAWGKASVILAVLIAFSRMYVGVHYPTDVLGGLMVGAVVSVLAVWIEGHAKR